MAVQPLWLKVIAAMDARINVLYFILSIHVFVLPKRHGFDPVFVRVYIW